MIGRALLLVALIAASASEAIASADAPATRDECEVAAGTWDRSPARPDGYCVPDTREKCVARGGAWKRVCLAQRLYCVLPTADGGKPCTDSSQCASGCTVGGGSPAGNAPAGGQCRRDNDPCGCWTYVRDGMLTPTLCTD
jgi:hypothetical protein